MNKGLEALQAYQEKIKQAKENGTYVPPKKLNPLEKAKANPKSLKCAIVAKCYECMSGYADGRYSCELSDCPLYFWMPYKHRIRPE